MRARADSYINVVRFSHSFNFDHLLFFINLYFNLLVLMANCGICVKPIKANQVKLMCSDCNGEFHAACFKMSRADVDCITADGLAWRCSVCAEHRRRSLRFDSEVQEGKLTLEDIMKKINEIADTQKSQEHNFNKSNEYLNKQMEENTKAVNDHNSSMKDCLKKIDDLLEENKRLSKKVAELEARVEDMEQYSRLNCVEIHGIPEQKNEDVVSVVKEVGKALDMNISDSMIDACHRLGRRTGTSGPPPGIIVKFVRRLDKDELLKKRRVKSNLSTRHMNLGVDQPVYINEALSPARRRLFAQARQVKREKNFKFLWVRGGRIFLRKEEQAPVIQVTCQADFSRL